MESSPGLPEFCEGYPGCGARIGRRKPSALPKPQTPQQRRWKALLDNRGAGIALGLRTPSLGEVTQGIARSSLPRFARPPGSLRLAISAALRFIPGLNSRSPSGFREGPQYCLICSNQKARFPMIVELPHLNHSIGELTDQEFHA